MKKTAAEWFANSLPPHLAAAAIRNLKTNAEGEYPSLPSALEGAFFWSRSPEGSEFWRELHRQYLAIEITELPKRAISTLRDEELLDQWVLAFNEDLNPKMKDNGGSDEFTFEEVRAEILKRLKNR